ncbi:DivIVA domain-containing protein [Agromyces laixinhei]|uniref:DivIVA domain-containing protein n=1 Tax=Agromyces laixinhei TaxID=2585717 RepID=UPI0012EE3F3A|nr:DivIVA domain-containing protein [Agromyces laixinhei]
MTTPDMDDQALLPGLSPRDISHASFPFAEQGGYDASAVRRTLSDAADQLAAAQAEIVRLRAEADQNDQNVRAVSEEAVSLISRAQTMADKHISDAEQYARDLIDTARDQYSDILRKALNSVSALAAAEEAAGAAAAEEAAEAAAGDGSGLDYNTPIQEIEFVRTYAKVAQVQLRAVIDAMTEQIDQLGQLPRFGTPPEAPQLGKPEDNGV